MQYMMVQKKRKLLFHCRQKKYIWYSYILPNNDLNTETRYE